MVNLVHVKVRNDALRQFVGRLIEGVGTQRLNSSFFAK